MKKIKLTKGKYALVDDSDFKKINEIKWHLSSRGYACNKRRNQKTLFMHRLINNTPDGMQTDHINKNKLDNRRSNLRTVSNQKNHWNMPIQKSNTSGFTGISWDKSRKKWVAVIWVNDKPIHLGRFSDKINAIIVRKEAKEKYHAI